MKYDNTTDNYRQYIVDKCEAMELTLHRITNRRFHTHPIKPAWRKENDERGEGNKWRRLFCFLSLIKRIYAYKHIVFFSRKRNIDGKKKKRKEKESKTLLFGLCLRWRREKRGEEADRKRTQPY